MPSENRVKGQNPNDVRNHLSHVQVAKLTMVVTGLQDYISKQCPPRKRLVAELSEKCGFPVTLANVVTITSALGVEWKPARESNPANVRGGKITQSIHRLKDRAEAAEARIAKLESLIEALTHDLGYRATRDEAAPIGG